MWNVVFLLFRLSIMLSFSPAPKAMFLEMSGATTPQQDRFVDCCRSCPGPRRCPRLKYGTQVPTRFAAKEVPNSLLP